MRYQRLDAMRGAAIILMVLFHLNYSLVSIFDNQVFNFSKIFWFVLGKIAALGFIFIAGMSFFFAHEKYEKTVYKKYFRYAIMLACVAGNISLVTYYLFPGQYIRFGILHFFAIGFLLLPILARFTYWNILIGASILIYGVFFIPIIKSPYWYWLGFKYPGFASADYYPIIPYLGVLLLGYSFSLIFFRGKYKSILTSDSKNIFFNFLTYCGKKSLYIYILHQPLIVITIYCLYRF